MISGLLLPDVERAFADARSDEVEIADHELEHGRLGASRPSPGQRSRHREEREDFERRPVILGARPTGEVKRPVRIDARFGQHRIAKDRRDFVVGPHILQEGGLNLLPEAPVANEAPARPARAALG